MKNRHVFGKTVTLLLVLSMLLSAFCVFTAADEETGSGGEEENPDHLQLFYYRNYDEGWGMNNGLSNAAGKNDNNHIAYEETDDLSYNYYLCCETFNQLDAFFELRGPGLAEYVALQYDIKIKDESPSGGIIYTRPIGGGGNTMQLMRLDGGELRLPAANNESGTPSCTTSLGGLRDEWVHVAYVAHLDTDATSAKEITYQIYYGNAKEFDLEDPSTYTTYSTTWGRPADGVPMNGFDLFRIGFTQDFTINDGERRASYCIDNLALYTGSSVPLSNEEIAAYGYGTFVNEKAAKEIEIKGNTAGEKTDVDFLNESFMMKTGTEYGLRDRKRVAILTNEDGVAYGAPQKVNGKVMVSLEAVLDYVGYPVYIHPDGVSYDIATASGATYLTVGRASASVSGERVELAAAPVILTSSAGDYAAICIDDIETLFAGYYLTYDDLGLIIIAEQDELLERDTGLATMLKYMKMFLFDFPTGETIYETVKKNTNGFTHPYLIATQETFDALSAAYYAQPGDEGYDEVYHDLAARNASSGISQYKKYVVEDHGEYAGLNPAKITHDPALFEGHDYTKHNEDGFISNQYLLYNPYETKYGGTNNSYDPDGGRLNPSSSVGERLAAIAMTYNITGELKYAEAVYDIILQMGTWDSWGEGHFLNCADATAPIAEAFDWAYSGIAELEARGAVSKTFGEPIAVVNCAQVIYNKGVSKGYISHFGAFKINRKMNGSASVLGTYKDATNNWNAVCTCGMVLGGLSILEFTDDEGPTLTVDPAVIAFVSNPLPTAGEQILKSLENHFRTLPMNGLDEYAPIGDYIESPSYWSYGTNAFFEMMNGVITAAGDDFGLFDCWGVDRTCYYACQTEYPVGTSYTMWSFHDSSNGVQDKSMFYFVGKYFGDDGLIALRLREYFDLDRSSRFDALNYDPSYRELDLTNISLDRDYWGEGIDLFCARSDWNRGCIYTGIMGESNSAPHGDIDAGTVIYANKNVTWLVDLGSENYNAAGVFGSLRNSYYRKGGEGQNHVILTSQPTTVMYGQLSTGTGEIYKTGKNEYGSYALMDLTSCYAPYVNWAHRGMMMTNDRTTVVYQDEIAFKGVESFAWLAHTEASVEISEDGKTAFLTQRAPDGDMYTIRLAIVATTSKYTFRVTDCYTFLLGCTVKPGESVAQVGVDEYSREGIKRLVIEGAGNSFELAVVVEQVDGPDTKKEVGYSWTPMEEWEPVYSTSGKTPGGDEEPEEEERVIEIGDVVTYSNLAGRLLSSNYAYTTRYEDFFLNMHYVAKTLDVFNINSFVGVAEVYQSYERYVEYLDGLDAYRESANVLAKANATVCDALTGYLG